MCTSHKTIAYASYTTKTNNNPSEAARGLVPQSALGVRAEASAHTGSCVAPQSHSPSLSTANAQRHCVARSATVASRHEPAIRVKG